MSRILPFGFLSALGLPLLALLLATPPALGQILLRDADIEHGLMRLASPVLRAAGLNPNRMRILVIDDGSLNAFVLDDEAIYLNSGLVLRARNAPMLQAVLAHEAAHIANGHFLLRAESLRRASNIANLGTLLAIATSVTGAGNVAAGILAGSQGTALRGYLSHTRAEESAADRSALHYMSSAGVSVRGMVDIQTLFAKQESLSVANQDPYTRTHPPTAERLHAAREYLARHGPGKPVSGEDAYWLERVQGKLSAFQRDPQWTFQQTKHTRDSDIIHMRKAVAHHRLNRSDAARQEMQSALRLRPDDPYYLELMGQIMLESRQWEAAKAAYKSAVAKAPREPLILGGYGRVLLALDEPKAARDILARAVDQDRRDVRLMADLARAYAATGDTGMAALTTAERHALMNNMRNVRVHAERAVAQLPKGSAGWRRAQDLLDLTETED